MFRAFRHWRLSLAAALLLGGPNCVPALFGQSVEVYSEFRRLNAKGEILKQDAPGTPREIISPAVGRNGYATFHVVLRAPADKKATLYLGSNPEGLIKTTLYEVKFSPSGAPDSLVKVDLPVFKFLDDGVGVYIADLFIPERTPVRRIRYEFQFNADDRWVTYPLEVRVESATVPQLKLTTGKLAAVSAPASESAFNVLSSYLCGKNEPPRENLPTIRALIRRNAAQDLALARKIELAKGRAAVVEGILKPLGAPTAEAWCAGHQHDNPETYLRVRDFLYRIAVN